MFPRLNHGPVLAVLLVSVTLALPACAQKRFEWPERSKNLQVLPKDTSAEHLARTMHMFTESLGVRCSFCHVGPAQGSLADFDFASDDNEHKMVARRMMRMLGVTQDSLAAIFKNDDDDPVEMNCYTCHRGRPAPRTLAAELERAYAKAGVDSTLNLYAKLRDRFYGSGSYDFGEGSLNEAGYAMLQKEDVAGAIKVFELNKSYFPESTNVFDSLGEAYVAAGRKDDAIQAYEKAVALEPRNRHAAEALKTLKEGK